MNEALTELLNEQLRLQRALAETARDLRHAGLARDAAKEEKRSIAFGRSAAALQDAGDALRLAFPELCEDLSAIVGAGARFDRGGVTKVVIPGSLAEPELSLAAPKLAALRAVAAALGEDLPPGISAILPAFPGRGEEGGTPDRDQRADRMSGRGTSKKEGQES